MPTATHMRPVEATRPRAIMGPMESSGPTAAESATMGTSAETASMGTSAKAAAAATAAAVSSTSGSGHTHYLLKIYRFIIRQSISLFKWVDFLFRLCYNKFTKRGRIYEKNAGCN